MKSLLLLLRIPFLVLVTVVGACSRNANPPTAPAPPYVEEPPSPPLFADLTAASKIVFTYHNGEEANHYAIIESLGGGVALIDYDHDGLLDIFLPGGGYYDGKKVLGHQCKLYRNLGGFKFEDVTTKVGFDKIPFPYSHGVGAFDFDCDGWPDLLVTGYNRLVLLRNEADGNGGRRFVDVTKKAKLNDDLWSASVAWGDLDGDGFPEIYVTHYGDWGFDTNHPTDCMYDGKTRDVCQPKRFKPLPHTLFKNNGDGTFTDVSAAVKLRKDGKGLGVMFVDVNNDGRPDIYVANDTDDNHLYMNRGKPGELVLEEIGLFAGVARDDRGVANGSMGIDAADFNRSGLASILVTNYEGELPALYRNQSDKRGERFTYDSLPSGVAAVGGSYVSWGVGFFDYDHDGWDDVMIVSGHAIRFPTKIDRRQKPILLRNESGKFTPTTLHGGDYFRTPHNARGSAFGDLDNDGKTDVVVSHLNEPVAILRNVAPTDGRHWVGVELACENGRSPVGARVVIETAGGKQTKFAKGGSSFASTNDARLIFGLGADAKLDKVTVFWPSGKSQEIQGAKPDAYWKITEGEADAKKIDYR
ncbi:MAG: CRTAC1 family protein [Planctomycetes bacterium]|nr:CRTAC1 family protein [Planctomycetota bacterium]